MYHGIPINSETIAIFFGVVVWIIRGIARAFKRAGKTGPAVPPLQAPPPSSVASGPRTAPPASPGLQPRPPAQVPPRTQAPPPSQTQPSPAKAPRLDSPRSRERQPQERQPQAGGPAVPEEATRRDFERQEQDLFASEPSALSTPLTSASVRPSASVNSLFGGTDDLVRAIILQEVLGPPLSRRAVKPGQAPE